MEEPDLKFIIGMKHVDEPLDIWALSRGDVQAFEALFRTYYPRVRSFLYSLTNDEDASDDLAQDTFVRLWTYRESLREVTNLNAYIYRTTKNVLFGYIEERQRTASLVSLDDTFTEPSIDEVEAIVYEHELEEALRMAVDAMPAQRRQVYRMSREQGMRLQEIAEALGISKRTVEAHLSTALNTLRRVALAMKSFLL